MPSRLLFAQNPKGWFRPKGHNDTGNVNKASDQARDKDFRGTAGEAPRVLSKKRPPPNDEADKEGGGRGRGRGDCHPEA